MSSDRRDRDLNYRRGRSGRPLEREKARIYRTQSICVICGREVDKRLPYRDPETGRVNLMSKSVEHGHKLDAGGTWVPSGIAHLRCNSIDGAHYRNAKHRKSPPAATEAQDRRRSRLPGAKP